MKSCILTSVLLFLCCDSSPYSAMKALYRVNCGSTIPYTDKSGIGWSADQLYLDTAKWGALGGNIVMRDSSIALADTTRPFVFRTERYGQAGYIFSVPDGFYSVRLYFNETWDSCHAAGKRIFDVAINGKLAIRSLDPFYEAGGFAKPCIYEITGIKAEKKRIIIQFISSSYMQMVNGIEILKSAPAPYKLMKVVGAKR